MSSTNKTPNLELSQFVANDIPSWLGDYNGDMLKIDTAVQSANATAAAASGTATTASNQAQNALNVANSAETRSTNNAEDITELKAGLINSLKSTTTIVNNVSTENNVVVSSDYITKINVSLGFTSNPTNGTVVDSYTRIPLFSVNENIFKISTSTLSDDTAKLYCCDMTLAYSNNTLAPVLLAAYYDGANTIFYTSIETSSLSNQFNVCWGNTVVMPTGNFVSPVTY